ncbi:MAG: hypothetical protein QNJ58_12710 [Desulfobacterales bacterium]|nr:hypothetical protein [Desulfobacterales bacterium]
MTILLKKATGISAGEFPKLVTCKWPLGRVTLYHDRIILDVRVEKYELLLADIEHFQINIFQVNIEHRNPNIIKDISINGIFTARAIRKAIEQYRLPVKVVP